MRECRSYGSVRGAPGNGRPYRDLFHALADIGGPASEMLLDSSTMKAHRCAFGGKGERAQAIGISRGGRTTKLHALSDERGRPRAFLVTGGQAADCRAAEALLAQVPTGVLLIADRGYDTNPVRNAMSAARCRTFRPRPTAASSRPSAGCCIAAATPSSGCLNA